MAKRKPLTPRVRRLPEVGAPVIEQAKSLDERRRKLETDLQLLVYEERNFVRSLASLWTGEELVGVNLAGLNRTAPRGIERGMSAAQALLQPVP